MLIHFGSVLALRPPDARRREWLGASCSMHLGLSKWPVRALRCFKDMKGMEKA